MNEKSKRPRLQSVKVPRNLGRSTKPRRDKFQYSVQERKFGILKVIYIRIGSTHKEIENCPKSNQALKSYLAEYYPALSEKEAVKKTDQNFNRFMSWLNLNYPKI